MFDIAGNQLLPYPLKELDPQSGEMRAMAVCFFHEEARINKAWSEQNGRPIYERVIVVTIAAKGSKNSSASHELLVIPPNDGEMIGGKKVERKVRENIMARPGIKEAFEAWEKKQEIASVGTPLETWPPLNKAQVMQLKHVNVFTVEDLAGLPDSALPNTNLGLHAREIRAKAQAYLESATDNAAVEKLAARLERLEQADKAKDDRIVELERENAKLKAKATPADDEEEPPPPATIVRRGRAAPAQAAAAQPRGGGGRFQPRAPKPPADDNAEDDVAAALKGQRQSADQDEDEDFV